MEPPIVERTVDLLDRRRQLLELLVETPHEKPAITDAIDRSRSTVDRAIRELTGAGLVERSDEGYVATVAGRLAVEQYRALVQGLDAIAAAQPLLEELPDGTALPMDLLLGAEVRLAQPPEPDRAYEPLFELLASARRYCALSASVGNADTGVALRDQVHPAGNSAAVVVDDDVATYLWREYADLVETMIVEGGLLAYAHPSVPYGLGIGYAPEGVTVIGLVYGDSGELVGVVVNDTPAAVDWAERTFCRYRAAATPLEPPE